MPQTSSSKPAIPVVDFYGEATEWPVTDLIHCENLSSRSEEHNWHIDTHRHQNLLQLFYVSQGTGEARVDDQSFTLGNQHILIIPPMCVHTLTWTPGSEGFVVLMALPLINRIATELESRPWSREDQLMFKLSDQNSTIATTLETLVCEYNTQNLHRTNILESLAKALMAWLDRIRQREIKKHIHPSKAEMKVGTFRVLLEGNFNRHHNVGWYADQLAITAPHLTSICQTITHKTALELIHERIMIEAKRSLLYTGKTTAEIGRLLGFTDPAYFNRFFKRMAGVTPGQFKLKTG